jgi:hypothetical protein
MKVGWSGRWHGSNDTTRTSSPTAVGCVQVAIASGSLETVLIRGYALARAEMRMQEGVNS